MNRETIAKEIIDEANLVEKCYESINNIDEFKQNNSFNISKISKIKIRKELGNLEYFHLKLIMI